MIEKLTEQDAQEFLVYYARVVESSKFPDRRFLLAAYRSLLKPSRQCRMTFREWARRT